MTTRLIILTVILTVLTFNVFGQALKEKVEMVFDAKDNLRESTKEFYNTNGQLEKSVTTNYRSNEATMITDYIYDEKGHLVKQTFSGSHSFQDSLKITHWTDTNIISFTTFKYNSKGQIEFENVYSFECDLDTCDITEYFYEENRLIKKFCKKSCSMKGLNYNYPIYYEYDKNDSLILMQVWGPIDTTKIWYANSYNYTLLPEKYIYEYFYRKDDSLQLENKIVTKTERLPDGRISKITYLERSLTYEEFEYYNNSLLKSQVFIQNGKPSGKYVYRYDKQNNVVRVETYDIYGDKDRKLRMNYYQIFEYKYH